MSSEKRRYELKARAAAQTVTRERIAAAAASLHEQTGIGKTPVADIARRAGVSRLTVYNHFPDLETLLPACTAHWLTQHPVPDFQASLALEDPGERLRETLTKLYAWYRDGRAMNARVNGERNSIPEVDAWISQSADPMLDEFTSRLSTGFDHPAARTLIALALDFWTWHR